MDVDIVAEVSREASLARLASALKKAELKVDRRRINSAPRSSFRIVTFEDSKTPFTVESYFPGGSLRRDLARSWVYRPSIRHRKA